VEFPSTLPQFPSHFKYSHCEVPTETRFLTHPQNPEMRRQIPHEFRAESRRTSQKSLTQIARSQGNASRKPADNRTESRDAPFSLRSSSRRRLRWRAQSASPLPPAPAPLEPGASSSPGTTSIRSSRSEKLTSLKANSKLGPPPPGEKSGSISAAAPLLLRRRGAGGEAVAVTLAGGGLEGGGGRDGRRRGRGRKRSPGGMWL